MLRVADAYEKLRTEYDPTLAIVLGLPVPEKLHLPDRSEAAIRALHRHEDSIFARLNALSGADTADAIYAILREELTDRRALRICRTELWDLSHTEGWQIEFPSIAAAQAVETLEERRRVLALWRGLPGYLRTDQNNLRTGLASGYSVPRQIVRRILRQLDLLASTSPDQSPFVAPATRVKDSAFATALRREVADDITPAIQRFAEFLRKEYLPRARESLGLSGIPNGAACYRAYLRRYTTTDESPDSIFRSGRALVLESGREIAAIGARKYQSGNVPTILRRARADPANRFNSAEDLIGFSERVVRRAAETSRSLFFQLPSQAVVVRPLPSYQRGSGVTSHYEANPDTTASATFWISTDDWATETRGAAAITAVHETIPGHHLQSATAWPLQSKTSLGKIVSSAAYVEGWANYAERLAEEKGLDDDDFERIQRRVLAGRSLVIDPGIHVFRWTRGQAEDYAMETGMSRDQADDVIDRIVVEPGQLTSYEVGGLAIVSLRTAARRCMGSSFDIRDFHQRVLELGPVPIQALRTHIERWLAASCPGMHIR